MPSDTLHLREAHSGDRAALVRLLHRTRERTFARPLPHGAFADTIAERYVDGAWPRFVVAERDGSLVGFADAVEDLIASLYVDPDAWGRGIGRRLLDECERRIAAGGYRLARLQVEAFDERLLGFCRKAGYVEIARRPDEELGSGGMSVFMVRPLRPGDERIRVYRPEDRAACFALFESNVPEYFAAAERADFTEQLNHLEGPYLVIENGGAVVACGGFQADRKDPSTAALCWGMVRRDLHGARLGESLLTARLDLIAANPVFESVVIETTPMSRGFFERYGFVAGRILADGFVPGYDLVEMTLRLDRRRAARRWRGAASATQPGLL